ncbi:MAG: glutamine--tRNA ligase, partial [Bacteroidia bacterium]|nr:glutamine--tRNA ligase [Bacteroidia bacterium]
DDPRMPTICGLRRRGYTADAIKRFAEAVGVAKRDNVIDLSLLEFYLREDLNAKAQRRMAVLSPLKVVIENYPEGQEEWLDAVNNPERIEDGVRKIPFSRELFIERDDFMQDPPKKFFRLAPGREVRLRYAYFITCREAVVDERGEVVELRCTYDPATKGGDAPDGRKVKSTIHWVSAPHAVKGKARLFDRLFMKSDPNEVEEGKTWKDNLNPESKLEVEIEMEPSLLEARVGEPLQFERLGYFAVDKDSSGKEMVFNRSVTLKDAWAKVSEQGR